MRNVKLRYIAAATAVLVTGVAAFLVGRYVISDDSSAVAQVNPSGTPVVVEQPPHPSIAAAMTAIAEDNTKPIFTGVFNGFTFIGEGTPFPQNGDCSSGELEELDSSDARTAIRESALDFQAADLGTGVRLVREVAVTCQDEVVAVSRVYEGSNNRLLSIVRSKAEPAFPAIAPKDRLAALTLGGRPSVLITSIGFSSTIIIMRDDEGTLWTINAEEIDEADVRKIAEGVK